MFENYRQANSGLYIPGDEIPEEHIYSNYKESPSGLLVPGNYKKYPTGFDFFAGAGGFSLGVIRAGFEVVGALEISPDAAHTYMVNLGSFPIQIHFTSDKHREVLERYFERAFKKIMKDGQKEIDTTTSENWITLKSKRIDLYNNISGSGWIRSEALTGKHYPPVKNFFFGDITEVSGEWILERLGMKAGELDFVFGGPPCQGFTRLNSKRTPFDPRNSLVFEFARRIVEMKPKTIAMEEVPDFINFVTPDGIPVIDALCMILEEGGFGGFDAMRSSLLATSGVGFIKSNTGFRDTKIGKEKKKKRTAKK